MNILTELRRRFAAALATMVADPGDALNMIRVAQDAKFGDFQANLAMPLCKQLGRPAGEARAVAAEIVAKLDIADLCETPVEIAGPGFINLRLKTDWVQTQLASAHRTEPAGEDRVGIAKVAQPKTFVIDYSSPNVAKPMHVGHIRSTVIGDSLDRTLRFLGHRVISDNHLGDWGTQFGMIIFGYKHFVDASEFAARPVPELTRLYKLVNKLVEYHAAAKELPRREKAVAAQESEVAKLRSQPPAADKQVKKAEAAALRKAEEKLGELREALDATRKKIDEVANNSKLAELAAQHSNIEEAVLLETVKLHEGDAENRRLWETFLPKCEEEIERVYRRLGVRFDHSYGESFYEDRLAGVVEEMQRRGFARPSEGAICIFIDGFETPMIIRKKDGAFLYATTDLATIQFRMQTWNPDSILYVVDHRQSEHFDKLFAAARQWGYTDVDLRHIQFGTVLGDDGKPYKTRTGETVGLESLLDEAVHRAYAVVCKNDDEKPGGAELDETERRRVAEAVGHAAIKYADLSHNRSSDYVFSYDKMVSMEGNTATYMQYSYARTQSIFAKGKIDVAAIRQAETAIALEHPMERALAMCLLRFETALDEVLVDYRPNQLTAYLYELATQFSRFYQNCKVLDAESAVTSHTRLVLCSLTGRTIRLGLGLLGIGVVERM